MNKDNEVNNTEGFQKPVDENKCEDLECSCKESKINPSDIFDKITEELHAAQKEATEMKELAVRTAAELENLRKRFTKEKEDALKYASTKFAKDLLSVIDNFERAISNATAGSSLESVIDGIKITEKEMKSIFQKHSIKVIEVAIGDTLDPNYHQVMCEVDDSDVECGKIAIIYQNGYTISDRLLRPALVGIKKRS